MGQKKRTHIIGSFAAALKVSVALVCVHLCENPALAATQKDLLTTATDISAGTSYVGGGTPLKTWDVNWTNGTYSATTFLLNSNLSIGTLNDLNASQALTLTNNGSANTTLTLNGGTDAVSGSAAGDLIYVAANGRLTIQNGTRTLNLALAASGNFNTGAGASLTIASVISGNASITKTGAGTTTLTGVNTFSGTTTVSAGVLNIQNAAALGTTGAGTTVNAGAALQLQGSIAVGAEAVTLNGSGIANDGALRSISGNNSWAGAVTLGSASTIASDSGTLTLSGALNNGGFAVTYGGAGSITASGVISGAGGLAKNGAGALTLSAANTFTGAIAINGGVVAIQNAGAFGTAANTASTTVANGATLQLSNSITTTNAGTLVLNGAGALQSVSGSNTWNSNVTIASNATIGSLAAGNQLTIGNATPSNSFAIGGNTVTFDGVGDTWLNSNVGVAGDTGSVIKNGTGRLIFYGTDSYYTGSTTVNAGTLELVVGPFSGALQRGINGPLTIGTGSANSALAGTVKVNIWNSSYDNQISSSSAVTIQSDGALNLGTTPMTGGAGTTGSTTLGTLTLNGGQVTMTSALSITPSGGITTNVNSAHQTAQITGGTLNIGAPTIFNVARDSSLTSDFTVASIVAGGSLTKRGAGVMTLTGANTFSGATIVDAGALNIQSATALGTAAGGTTVNAGAALQIQGNIAVGAEAVTLNGGGVASDGALRNISGNNSWAGAVTLGAASTIASDSGALILSGTVNNAGFAATFGGAGNITASGTISGAGGLVKSGTGTLTVTGANTMTGGVAIYSGTIVAGNNSAFGPLATQTITFNGGKLASDNAARSLANNLIVNPASGNAITGANSLTLTGAASANGELEINFGNSAAVLTVNPTKANSFAPGLIRLTSGTLLLGGSDKIGNNTALALAGGKLNTGGFSDQLGALSLQASSTIDFGTTNNVRLQFSSAAWDGGTLNIANWTGAATSANNADQLLFSGPVSVDVLNHIAFAGYGPGAIAFDRGNGMYEVAPVPEPATVFGALGLAGFVAFRERRRIAGAVGTAFRR